MGNFYSAFATATFGDTAEYLDGPVYSVIEAFEGYELRRYDESMWMATQIDRPEDPNEQQICTDLFYRLFNYISGKENEEKRKMEMTTPVVVKPCGEAGFKMNFFVPFSHQANPPKPSETNVTDEKWPACEFYVRRFSPPNTKLMNYVKEKTLMISAMERDGLALKENFVWMRAGYDPPYKLANRRSEVWIPADQVTRVVKVSSEESASGETDPADKVKSEKADNEKSDLPDNEKLETPDNAKSETPDNAKSETPDNAKSETPDNAKSETPDNAKSETPDNAKSETPDNAPSEAADAGDTLKGATADVAIISPTSASSVYSEFEKAETEPVKEAKDVPDVDSVSKSLSEVKVSDEEVPPSIPNPEETSTESKPQ